MTTTTKPPTQNDVREIHDFVDIVVETEINEFGRKANLLSVEKQILRKSNWDHTTPTEAHISIAIEYLYKTYSGDERLLSNAYGSGIL